MRGQLQRPLSSAGTALRFARHVLSEFRANQGILLASGVAYNALLSIVPMLAVILVLLSHFADEQALLQTTHQYVGLIVPGQEAELTAELQTFLENRQLVGVIGFVTLIFFSSFAFTMLENAMSVIFYHRVRIRRRHFAVSAVLPYVYILLLAIGLLLLSGVSAGLRALQDGTLTVLGWQISLDLTGAVLIYLFGLLAEVLLLTSLYLVMPVGRIALRHALMGGLTAALLWEVTRHVLAWYFASLSYVNLIYGSFTTVVVILLGLEIGAVILLLGAQVIAEYERRGHAGGPPQQRSEAARDGPMR